MLNTHHEDKRIRALQTYQILDTLPEKEFDRITELASIICGTPISLVSLIDETRQWFKSAKGLDIRETPRNIAFCHHTIQGSTHYEVEDATAIALFKDNPLVTGNPNIRSYTGYPLIDNNGFALGTLCVIDTIPKKLDEQQKRGLQLLAQQVMTLIDERQDKEELQHYEKLFNLSIDILAIAGIDGYFKKVNPAFKNLLEYDTEYMLETAFVDLLHPDDVQKTIDEVSKLAAGITTLNFVNRYRKKNGEYIYMQWTAMPEPESGKMFCVGRDVTKEKARDEQLQYSEKHFRDFFDYSQGMMCTHDLEGKFLTINASSAKALGYTIEELKDKTLYDIVPPPFHRQTKRYLKKITEKGRYRGIMNTVHKDGSIRTWLFNNVLSTDINDQFHVIGNALDITEQQQLEAELKKAKKQAEQANVAKSDFLASMSHEIRTPLNGVIGFTDLLLKTKLSEMQTQYLSIVNQSANTLLSVINDILDFSKIEAGKLELDLDKCDLFEMAHEASDIVSYQAQSKGLEMLLNVSPDLPRFVWIDSVRLKQVLVNLLGNAVKFTENGEVELRIQAMGPLVDNNIPLRFEVRDTGIGIKNERQLKVFKAFFQEDVSTTKKYGGTGLGLAISNKLLKLMNSELKMESEVGKGTTFYFDIVVAAQHGHPIVWENMSHIKKVLIVDDNENNRKIIKAMLALKHIQSDEAKNGMESLELLATGTQYDVIMMDYYMPVLNGLETIERIRALYKNVQEKQPVILLHSSSDDESIVKACHELNIEHRLLKPIKMKSMYDVLSRLFVKKVAESATVVPVEQSMNGKHTKILLADDNRVNTILAMTILKNIMPDSEIVSVENGVDAVTEFDRFLPDIVLMDIQMPKMNGYEVTKAIRQKKNGARVPIIALTAGNVKGERERCMDAGMDDFVAKPFVQKTLETVLEKWKNAKKGGNVKALKPDDVKRHFNVEKLKMYMGGSATDERAMKAVLIQTIQELNIISHIIKMDAPHATRKDWNIIGHKLYGTTSAAGLEVLSTLAMKLELLANNGEVLNDLIDKILEEIEIGIDLIKKHIK